MAKAKQNNVFSENNPNNLNPYVRDVFLAYLIKGATLTKPDGYPIIEKFMVAEERPEYLYQWNQRTQVKVPEKTGMNFYNQDEDFNAVINNPKRYIEKLKSYACIIGIDPSPYDNMPLVVQKSQIFNNLALTYYFGMNDLKVIPNVRLGNDETISALDAFPRGTLISVGTNGFMKRTTTRQTFKRQLEIVIDVLAPTGILVYGIENHEVFNSAYEKNIPVYQYDSCIMTRNKLYKSTKEGASA